MLMLTIAMAARGEEGGAATPEVHGRDAGGPRRAISCAFG